jgi:C-terminal processing protease CtpA/Prc
LVSIDKTPIWNIINELFNYISGETNYYKNSYIEKTSLPLMLWLTHKHKHSYKIETNDKNGITHNLEIKTIRGIKYFNGRQQSDPFTRKLHFFDSIAYLTPGSFYNTSEELLSKSTFDTRSYLQFLENSFTEIKNRKSENLIIDLRNNEGGMSLFSMPLVTYFADTLFMSNMNVTYKTSQITKKGLQVLPDSILSGDDILLKNNLLSHQNGELFDMTSKELYCPVNDSIRFKGNVYILINRFTNSEAIVISSLIQDYEFALLVGEITPNTATQYASIQQFELPNTKLKISYPRAYLERKKGETSLIGVMPDYIVTPHLSADKDKILDL